jgi:hypothetical protein
LIKNLTAKETAMHENTDVIELKDLIDIEIQECSEVASLKKETDWFVGIDEITGARRYYREEDLDAQLASNILQGRHKKNAAVVVHSRTSDGRWDRANTNLFEFIKCFFKFRILYQPVWAHMLAGFKWGGIIGIILKLIDAIEFIASIDPPLAFIFLVLMGACFIPCVRNIAVPAVSIAMVLFTNIIVFITLIVTTIIGAALGGLYGVAIGGIIGFVRNSYILKANGVAPEPESMFYKAVLLPLAGAGSLFALYLFV